MTSLLLYTALMLNPSVLFVGNSYTESNGGIWNQVKEIYDSVESDFLIVDAYTAGGATFKNHWENESLIEEIQSGLWDTVVFQEQSCMPVIDPVLTYLYGDSLAWLTLSTGSAPVFFMTWARKNDPCMLDALNPGYSRMGFSHNSNVAPCGVAFDLIRRENAYIDPYSSDGAHPSVCGTYLSACVIALTLYDLDVSGTDVWQPSGISLEDGEILRQTAVQACTDYLQPSSSGE